MLNLLILFQFITLAFGYANVASSLAQVNSISVMENAELLIPGFFQYIDQNNTRITFHTCISECEKVHGRTFFEWVHGVNSYNNYPIDDGEISENEDPEYDFPPTWNNTIDFKELYGDIEINCFVGENTTSFDFIEFLQNWDGLTFDFDHKLVKCVANNFPLGNPFISHQEISSVNEEKKRSLFNSLKKTGFDVEWNQPTSSCKCGTGSKISKKLADDVEASKKPYRYYVERSLYGNSATGNLVVSSRFKTKKQQKDVILSTTVFPFNDYSKNIVQEKKMTFTHPVNRLTYIKCRDHCYKNVAAKSFYFSHIQGTLSATCTCYTTQFTNIIPNTLMETSFYLPALGKSSTVGFY